MRTTHRDATVRLYFLDADSEGGAAKTLFYGPLTEAIEIAAAQPEPIQENLYLATDNDVVAYFDLIGG